MAAVIAFSHKLDLQEAKRVLKLESEALATLSETLNETFTQAIEFLQTTKGRVIVTGMGKSGHVARKIAATLSSTGTPALFVHPAEASHGDLGMITAQDCVLALSATGETTELSDVIEHTRRCVVPLIVMTQNPQSILAQIATVVLLLPKLEEACAIGLAPTTSTTMMMALGDAIATTLMKRQGFSPADFGALHPGGKLGQRLKRVQDLMHTGDRIPLLSQESTMQEALLIMTSKSFGCVGLVDDQEDLTGIITDGDLRRNMSSNLLDLKAYQVMTPSPKIVKGNVLAQEALAILNHLKRTTLFVLDEKSAGQKPIGIIHIHDFLRAGIK